MILECSGSLGGGSQGTLRQNQNRVFHGRPTAKPAPYPPGRQLPLASDSASYPPEGQGLTKPSKYHENQAAIKRCKEIGFTLMPGVENAITVSVTKSGSFGLAVRV